MNTIKLNADSTLTERFFNIEQLEPAERHALMKELAEAIGRGQCADCEEDPQFCEICEGGWIKGFKNDDDEDEEDESKYFHDEFEEELYAYFHRGKKPPVAK